MQANGGTWYRTQYFYRRCIMASNNTIRYALRQNKLVSEGAENDCARVRRVGTIDQGDPVELMTGKNTTVTRQDIIVVLDLCREVLHEQLLAGNAINTDVIKAVATIRGTFASSDDEFDRSQHSIGLSVSANNSFARKIGFEAAPEKMRVTRPAPEIDSVYDYRTGSKNESVWAGYTAEIHGAKLNTTTAGDGQGVFFVNAQTGESTRVDRIVKETGMHVVFKVPETVSPGSYTIVVRRLFGSELKEGNLSSPVNAAAI
jgi:hypothetical protein